ncbi:ribonuclease T2-like protein [Bisporella sp. PMI_857]|nr:ribonuclease T2-like protein [Bisporella sp. PMI_857]
MDSSFALVRQACQNNTAVSDLCCFNAPGGQMLQTQFWDTNPSTGISRAFLDFICRLLTPFRSNTHWTLHGLWPDHCDGTYDANCDSSRNYGSINSILKWRQRLILEHEWEKHGTCISTLKTSCYTSYTSKQEVVDYFQTAVDLFKTLDSYAWLAAAGIVPSSTATYTSAAIQAALKKGFGYSIWYSYNVKGSVQSGTFIPVNPSGTSSTCASSGIKYLPKSGSASPTTTAPTSTPTSGTGFSGSGYLNGYVGTTQTGCLISAGTWYSTGTCATYTATASGSGFTLKSSKGNCAISSGTFSCASGLTATVFTASGGKLAYNGATTFYAAAIPSGTTQQTVYTTSNSVSVAFQWQSV